MTRLQLLSTTTSYQSCRNSSSHWRASGQMLVSSLLLCCMLLMVQQVTGAHTAAGAREGGAPTQTWRAGRRVHAASVAYTLALPAFANREPCRQACLLGCSPRHLHQCATHACMHARMPYAVPGGRRGTRPCMHAWGCGRARTQASGACSMHAMLLTLRSAQTLGQSAVHA